MPTTQTAHLPKPKNWDEFENICLLACEIAWFPIKFTRHGRQGQNQQGVDIYGSDESGKLFGIQCKNSPNGISTKTIDDEVIKAENFRPPLSVFYIATTADTDASLQQYVRTKSNERLSAQKFPINILFWEDITRNIACDTETLKKLYPQFVLEAPTASTPRDRDIKELTRLLEVIDILNIERYFDYYPKYIAIAFLEHVQEFQDIVNSPIFYIDNKNLEHEILYWLNAWIKLVGRIREAPYDGAQDGRSIVFPMPMDCVEPQYQEIYEALENVEIPEFLCVHSNFCRYLRHTYPEVDVNRTSALARGLYTPHFH